MKILKLFFSVLGAVSMLLSSAVPSRVNAAPTASLLVGKSHNLSSTVLANYDMDLFNFSTTSSGGVSIKQFVVHFEKTSGVSLSNVRLSKSLLKNGVWQKQDIPVISVNVVCVQCSIFGSSLDIGPKNLWTGVGGSSIPATKTNGMIVISFGGEYTLEDGRNDFTVHATVSGAAGTGKSLTLRMLETNPWVLFKGFLVKNSAAGSLPAHSRVFNIDTSTPGDNTANVGGTFVWSDKSAGAAHTYKIEQDGGSSDWYHNAFNGTPLISFTLSS